MAVFNDLFTDTAGTSLLSHTPSGGGSWAGSTSIAISDANRARTNSGSAGVSCISSATPAGNDHDVEADLVIFTLTGIDSLHTGVIACADTNSNNESRRGYVARLEQFSGSWVARLSKKWAGTELVFGSTTAGTSWNTGGGANAVYHLKLTVRANSSNRDVAAYLTNSSGQYLKPDGTWQTGSIAFASGTDTSNIPTLSPAAIVYFNTAATNTTGIHIDNFIVSNVGAGFISVSPTTVTTNSSGNSLTLTGTNTTWTAGTPGTPTFTASAGSITAQTVTSATSATLTYTAPSSAQTVTLTDPSTNFITSLTINSPSGLLAGTSSFVSATNAVANLSCTTPSGGTTPYSYQWQRSLSATGSFTNIVSATSLSLADSGIVADTEYWWQLKITDSGGTPQVVYSNVIPGRFWKQLIVLGFIGDSITASSSAVDTCVSLLAKLTYQRLVTKGSNQGISSTTTGNWISGSTNLNNAKSAFATAGVTHVHIMLGTNDAGGVSAASYGSNMSSIVTDLVSSGYKVILSYPIWSNWAGAAGQQRLFDYQAQIDLLVNNTTVFNGDRLGFEYFSAHPNELGDGVHPSSTGRDSLGQLWANGIDASLNFPTDSEIATAVWSYANRTLTS